MNQTLRKQNSNFALQDVSSNCLKGKNPVSAFATQSLETTFTTDTHCSADLEEVIRVAPGEGKNPASVLIDTYCEEIAYPHLFPSGKYCYKVHGDIPLSAKKHFSQRLLKLFTGFSCR